MNYLRAGVLLLLIFAVSCGERERDPAAGAASSSDASASTAAAGRTLEAVRAKGFVQCGVSQGLPGFSNPDDQGNWTGIDAEFCRAVAAAIFGDATKVKFTALSSKERFTALQSGEIDVLSRNTTFSMSRDTNLGLDFVGVNYYDGQGMMVRKTLSVSSATQLDGATVCTNSGTTTELNISDYFRTNSLKFDLVAFEKSDEVVAAYDAGRCDVYTTDQSGLYADRLKLQRPDDHMILPEVISKEPLGPSVRQGDAQWADIVRWTHNAMLTAEELGVSRENVEEELSSTNPEVRRLLGKEGAFGEGLGLTNAWAFHIINQVGNYGEVFERTVGRGSPLQIDRGLNALWTQGGLQYAPPIR